MKHVATLMCAVLLAWVLASCAGEDSSSSVAWLREPLEVVWTAGDDVARVVYTVSYDSPDTHRTALVLATAGDAIGFDEGSVSDANGNAPLVPGTEISSAFGLWSPQALRLGERSFVFVIVADADGSRRLQRISWTTDPGLAVEGALPGTNGVRAFHVVAYGERLYVVAVGASEGTAAVRLTVLDAEGEPVGEPTTLPDRAEGLVQAVWLDVRDDEEDGVLDGELFVQSCEGCPALTEESWESDLYDVVGRWRRLGFQVVQDEFDTTNASPDEVFRWDALVERAVGTPTEKGMLFSYWRTTDDLFPGCHGQGHCAIERTLVVAAWDRDAAAFDELAELSTSEIAYLHAVDVRDGEPWILWRERDENERWRRSLVAARLGDEADVRERFNVAETYASLLLAADMGGAAETLPFEYVDSIATRAADDGLWIAMRYRDLPPGATQVCEENVRVGIWTGRIAPDGTLLQQSEDRANLALDVECSGGGCSAGPKASFSLPFLLLLAFVALRRRRSPCEMLERRLSSRHPRSKPVG